MYTCPHCHRTYSDANIELYRDATMCGCNKICKECLDVLEEKLNECYEKREQGKWKSRFKG